MRTRRRAHDTRPGLRRSQRASHGAPLAPSMAVAVALAACGAPASDASPAETPTPDGVHGVAPTPVGGTPSVIELVAAGDGGTPLGSGASEGSPAMDQLGLVFTPTTLIARLGEAVVFTNSETIAHNVHVAFTDNDSTVLDVETDPGARAEFVFDRTGGYDVTCDHHPGMRAFVYVTQADRAVFADNSGAFVVSDVPPGAYTLSVWSVDPRLRSQHSVQVSGPSTEVVLQGP